METYIVKSNDTLDTIANSYNIKKEDIINANNLQMPFMLFEGQALLIPVPNYNIFDYYVVQSGDTLYSIANKYGMTANMLALINGIKENDYIYSNQTILVPKSGITTYITKPGDTILNVADNLKVAPSKILQDNTGIYLLPDQLIIVRNIY